MNLVYDGWNRLVAVYADDGTADDALDDDDTALVTYARDGLHRRIHRTVDPDDTAVDYDDYYNVSWQVLEVRKESDADPLDQYVWDVRYIDAAVVRFRDGNTDGIHAGEAGGDASDNTLYYMQDANFNVTGLVRHRVGSSADTSKDGKVVERYMYTPYGQPTVLNGESGVDADGVVTDWSADASGVSDWDNELLYCGYRWASETGLYDVRHRPLHPTLGRWTSRDPFRRHDVRAFRIPTNLVLYASGGPTNRRDPTGLFDCCGPEVGAQLRKVLQKIEDEFDALSPCDKIKKCGVRGWSWDIDQLHSAIVSTEGPGNCATGDCGKTASVDGKCYSVHAINYAMWGKINRLCHIPLSTAAREAMVWTAWNRITGDERYTFFDNEKRSWTEAGYSGSLVATSRHEHCTSCGAETTFKEFTYGWDPMVTGVHATAQIGLDLVTVVTDAPGNQLFSNLVGHDAVVWLWQRGCALGGLSLLWDK